ncbi:MAG: tetratricopeptide repeat protein [Legionellaceae bacterium]|nr:tetratricopeptide repeat protein [Legionellaceae bacterium]
MKILIAYGLLIFASITHASTWSDLWKNTNQRAVTRLEEKQFDAAEQTFTRKDWQGVAAFRNQHYAAAEKGFQTQDGAEGFYNQGNALAFQEKYKQAIEAYQKALKLEPKHQDAKYNLALLEDMQKNNPPEPDQSDQSDQSDNSDSSDKSDNNQNKTNNAGNDEGNSNQEQPPKDGNNKQASNQKQDGSNSTPSKPESSESESEAESESKQASEQPSKPEAESSPEAKSEEQANTNPKEQGEKNTQHASASPTDVDQQAKEQWLRLIPDDPGGLLREKFWRDHMKRLQQRRS